MPFGGEADRLDDSALFLSEPCWRDRLVRGLPPAVGGGEGLLIDFDEARVPFGRAADFLDDLSCSCPSCGGATAWLRLPCPVGGGAALLVGVDGGGVLFDFGEVRLALAVRALPG